MTDDLVRCGAVDADDLLDGFHAVEDIDGIRSSTVSMKWLRPRIS
jgi:hypothetical protein